MSKKEEIITIKMPAPQAPVKPKEESKKSNIAVERKSMIICVVIIILFAAFSTAYYIDNKSVKYGGVIEKMPFKIYRALKVNTYHWIRLDNQRNLPNNTISAGINESSNIYILRVHYNGNNNYTIGKYAPWGTGYITINGTEKYIYSGFDLLTASSFSWVKNNYDWNKVYAEGYEGDYVCRADHKPWSYRTAITKVPGFVDASGNCTYSYGGKGFQTKIFEVLNV
jgi:hypothetical protein